MGGGWLPAYIHHLFLTPYQLQQQACQELPLDSTWPARSSIRTWRDYFLSYTRETYLFSVSSGSYYKRKQISGGCTIKPGINLIMLKENFNKTEFHHKIWIYSLPSHPSCPVEMDWVWPLGLQPSWGRFVGSSGLNTTMATVKSSANLPEWSLQLESQFQDLTDPVSA